MAIEIVSINSMVIFLSYASLPKGMVICSLYTGCPSTRGSVALQLCNTFEGQIKTVGCVSLQTCLPSGKHTKNHGKSPCFSG